MGETSKTDRRSVEEAIASGRQSASLVSRATRVKRIAFFNFDWRLLTRSGMAKDPASLDRATGEPIQNCQI